MSSHPQSGPVQIRVAEPAEVIAAVPLVNEAFGIVESYFEGPRTTLAEMEKKLRTGTFLIAKGATTQHTVALVYVEIKDGRGYFGMLAVDPAHQGAGLGRQMIEAAEEYCRRAGCTHMDIHVLSLRTELPPFYRKLGYVETGTTDFHPLHDLKPGLVCHVIVMSKTL
ncbi:MAG TPA: GNAT family N-acetyltransferase [Terriglobales bacterium]